MNIVVLDGGTTNPGDISWEALEQLGTLTVYQDTLKEQVWERAKEAEALIVNRVAFPRELLVQLPRLSFLGMLATGYNAIDTAAARELGVTVCNVPLYCAQTVAQCAFSLLTALCSHVAELNRAVKESGWSQAVTLSHTTYPVLELSGKTLGIFGFGAIGAAMARMGQAFGMKILLCSRTLKNAPPDCRWVDMETLFRESDAVSLHCPLTAKTRGLVDKRLLSLMKPTAFLLNTARGAVIEEQALAEALNSGTLAGAGLDVLCEEPPSPEHPLLHARNCLITPHVAWSSREARTRLVAAVAENLRCFQAGTPQNVVN